MKKLQVLVSGRWEYVFARCGNSHKVLTTKDKTKALPTNACWGQDDLNYFKLNYPDKSFRLGQEEVNNGRSVES